MKKLWSLSFNGNGFQNVYLNGPTFHRLPLLLLFSTSTGQCINNNTNTRSSSSSSSSSSLLVNYLINSLGFSKPQSLSTSSTLSKRRNLIQNSKLTDIDLIHNANNVVDFFKKLGFQQPHIRKLIILEPRILISRVDKTLKPKINILLELGFSGFDLIYVILRDPMMLKSDLKPPINALRIVLGNDHDVVTVLKRYNKIYFSPVAKYLIPNVELLQNRYGISRCKIQKGVIQKLTCFVVRNDVFRDKLIRVEEKLGIPRDSGMFLYGLFLTCYSEKSIEEKCRLFRSFGWTQSEVAALIRRNPMCFTSAQGSIRERLEFLMKQLGYKPSYLASQPNLFTYSVKKRLLPRNRVLEVLKGKGLLRVNYTLVSAASLTEPLFLKKFVLPFEEVHQVYAKLTGSAV